MMKNKIRLTAETTSYAYVTLQNAAKYALETAEKSEKSRFFNSLSAMLYAAFSLEAYLNHVGEHEDEHWEGTKYRDPKSKLRALVKKRDYNPDFKKRPFGTFNEIFGFRKQLVHAETQHLKIERIRGGRIGDKPELPMTK